MPSAIEADRIRMFLGPLGRFLIHVAGFSAGHRHRVGGRGGVLVDPTE